MQTNLAHHIQGSPEWLAYRKTKIGASDAPIIMGDSPWKNIVELWKEKCTIDATTRATSKLMQRGIDLEPVARSFYIDLTHNFVAPAVLDHPSIEFMMASLDGITYDRKTAVEIKCAGAKDHATAVNGIVPKKYYAQLQHQIEVAGLDDIDYFSFDGNAGVIVNVKRDQAYIDKLLAEEAKFWHCVTNLIVPTTMQKHHEVENEEWHAIAREYKAASHQLKQLEEKQAELRNRLIILSNNRNSSGSGICVTHCTRRGSINIERLIAEEKIDVEIYRSADVSFWKITDHIE